MENKKIIIGVSFFSIVGLIACIVLALSFGNSSSKTMQYSPSNNTEVADDIEEDSINAEITKEDDNIPDFSNYKVDSKYELDLEFLGNKFSVSEANKNLMLDANTRLKYVNHMILKNGEYKLTTDQAQQSAYVTKEYYAEQFKNYFGGNYSYEDTIKGIESMWYSDCHLYPSVYDGKHICFTNISGVHAPTYFVDLKENIDNKNLKVSGTYHIGNTKDYHETGTFEIEYDISSSNRTMLGIRYTPSE